jgi:hypothetical protein
VNTFENDIEDQVKARDRLLAALLAKPSTVAEAFIQAGRKNIQLDDVNAMKSLLVGFFYPETLQFKELQTIFNLNIREIYQHAFLNFGIIRQLILRITGRHESFRKKFTDQSQSIYRRMVNEAALPGNYQRHISDASSGNRSRKSSRSRRLSEGGSGAVSSGGRLSSGRSTGRTSRAGSATKTNDKVGAAQTEQIKRPYSRQERDDAWKEFRKSLKK